MNDSEKLMALEALMTRESFDGERTGSMLELAGSIIEPSERALALLALARFLAEMESFPAAEEAARRIEYSYERSEAMQDIGSKLVSAGSVGEGVRALDSSAESARQLDIEWQKAERLGRIAAAFLRAREEVKAREVFREAAETARRGEHSESVQDSVDCSSVLREIARTLASSGLPEEALEVARSINNAGVRDKVLQELPPPRS